MEPAGESVSTAIQPGSGTEGVGSTTPAPTPPTALEPSTSVAGEARSDVIPVGTMKLRSPGFSDSVIARIQESRALSTRKHYKSQWDLFV